MPVICLLTILSLYTVGQLKAGKIEVTSHRVQEGGVVVAAVANRILIHCEEGRLGREGVLGSNQSIVIENATAGDTGNFYCSDVEGEREGEREPGSEVYLYVEDPAQLFRDKNKIVFVNINQDETQGKDEVQHLGCRPASPRAQIRVIRNGVDITSSLASHSLSFSQQSGLSVYIREANVADHGGQIDCLLSLPGTNQPEQIQILYIRIVSAEDKVLPTPRIHDTTCQFPILGDPLTLSCTVQVTEEQYKKHGIDLYWKFPSMEETETGRVILGNKTVLKVGNQDRVITKNLIFTNVESRDSGQYLCQAKSKPGAKSGSAGLKLTVVPRDHLSVKFRGFNGHYVVDIDGSVKNHNVTWAFEVCAHPHQSASYIWRGPRGDVLDSKGLHKYEKTVTGEKVKLVIYNPTLVDMGPYPIEVRVEKDGKVKSESAVTYLKVRQDAKLTVSSSKSGSNPFYELDGNYTMKCRISGYPVDIQSVETFFYPCDSYNSCHPNQTMRTPVSVTAIDDVTDPDYHHEFLAVWLPGTMKGSGVVGCSACTKGNPVCPQTHMEYFLSESERGHSITGLEPGQEVVEGDTVQLRCLASKYKYLTPVWTYNNQENETDPILLSSIPSSTDYSLVQTLVWDNISLDDSGDYMCSAPVIDSNITRRDVLTRSLVVLTVIKPTPVNLTMMSGETLTLKAESELELVCMMTGRPQVVIDWYKDDTRINQTNFVEIQEQGQKLKVKFLRQSDSGEYRCVGSNRGGSLVGSVTLTVVGEHRDLALLIGLPTGAGLALLVLILLLLHKTRALNRKVRQLTAAEIRLFEEGDIKSINKALPVDEQTDLLPYNKEFEFPRERLILGKQLGAGAFGKVVKAEATGIVAWEPVTTVAVKMVKPAAELSYLKALMSELKIMVHLGRHLNIVNLLGACTTNLKHSELLVVLEYCRFGNLQKYLINHRNHYINQIDPVTGTINFDIGRDNLQRGNIDFATDRERAETSAHYYVRSSSEYVTTTGTEPASAVTSATYLPMSSGTGTDNGSYLAMTSPPAHLSSFPFTDTNGDTRCRIPSVRYTREPSREQENSGKQTGNEDGTGTSTDTEKTSDQTNNYRESQTGSSQPGWRSNIRGDYKGQELKPISTKDLLCWAYQVSRGMEYLASKKILHGDLAARNILLAADNVVKICDFGLAKDIYKTNNYQKKSDGPLPVKWLAIECIRDRLFSTQSDVWAFGIVLWEFFSLGKTPYPGLEAGDRFYDMLLNDYRMPQPGFAPREVYKVMSECWAKEPTHRPRFRELADRLGDMLETGQKEHYMSLGHKCEEGDRRAGDILLWMAAPDYQTMTGALSEECCPKDLDGYLVPSPNCNSYKQQEQEESLREDESGYLLANNILPTHKETSFTESHPQSGLRNT